MSARGFILHPTYRMVRRRPVVHLYGRLESGETFLVRDGRDRPRFYIAAEDVGRAATVGIEAMPDDGLRTMDGRPAARVEVDRPADAPLARDRLQGQGIATYEADVRFAIRYLMDRGIRAAVTIEGEPRSGGGRRDGVDRVYDDPRLAPADFVPRLDVLSFDIETDLSGRRLLSIALHGEATAEVLLHCPPGLDAPPGATPFASEADLLAAFVARVRELDPDVLTGWNVIDFDLRVLDELASRYRVDLALGRDGGRLRLRPTRSPWGNLEATVPGRVVLDGPRLLRGSFVRMDSYGLDAVAREVLGEGKLIHGSDRGQAIQDAFRHERGKFVEYNLKDARLVSEILQRLRLVELAVERAALTGMPLDRVASSVAAFDFLYLSALGRRGVVAPTVHGGGDGIANLGGQVFEPVPGLYRNVLVFDFKSLYPSLIRTFHIDPLGYVATPTPDEDVVIAPNGAAFLRRPGILPGLLDELFPRREAARAAGDEVASHAIKILMNSMYGVLGTPSCRFHHPHVAGAITAFGRELLRWTRSELESWGHEVLYGDTDSLFVLSGEEDPARAWNLGGEILGRLGTAIDRHVRATWGVESRLELELETLYRRLLLPPIRGSQGRSARGGGRAGARKRYAGLVGEGETAEVVFTGLEVVRRDWTELAKRVQRELYSRLFHDRPIERYLRDAVAAIRRGELDGGDELVYRKALRKDLDEYTATTPPHVAAARKQQGDSGRIVAYRMTTAGPEPVGGRRSPIDHEHYVQKQVRPVAEPVLGVLGLDFDKVIGDDAQLELFA